MQTPQNDAAVLVELARLDPLAYERARWDAARRLRCRIRVLDALVAQERRHARRVAAEAAWASAGFGDSGRQ